MLSATTNDSLPGPPASITPTATGVSARFKNMDIGDTFREEDLSKTDFFDFVTSPSPAVPTMGEGESSVARVANSQPATLERFEQFWEQQQQQQKDPKHYEAALFEDLNRYCWNQQSTTSANTIVEAEVVDREVATQRQVSSDGATVDGNQIYTLTVLNGPTPAEPDWMGGRPTIDKSTPSAIDLDTILNGYAGYIKTECFPYDDSGFGTNGGNADHAHQQLQHATQSNCDGTAAVLSAESAYQGSINNNDPTVISNESGWHLTDSNRPSAESLLRSALQGKGYTKGLAVLPSNKEEEVEMRQALYASDPELLAFADPTIHYNHQSTNNLPPPVISQHATGIVDEMFLSLDQAFTDDYEKLKRITCEVQQFCNTSALDSSYSDLMINAAAVLNNNNNCMPNNNNGLLVRTSDVTTTFPTTASTTTVTAVKSVKKYKKTNNHSNNNNNNSNTMNNLNHTGNGISSTQLTSGQRKERSLHYCQICSKGFKDKYSVNVHVRTHTGEKPFACTLCGKSFRQKAHLAKHYQTHMAQKNSSKGANKNGNGRHSNTNCNNNILRGAHGVPQPSTLQLSQPMAATGQSPNSVIIAGR